MRRRLDVSTRWVNESPVFTGLDLQPELLITVPVLKAIGRLVDRWRLWRWRQRQARIGEDGAYERAV